MGTPLKATDVALVQKNASTVVDLRGGNGGNHAEETPSSHRGEDQVVLSADGEPGDPPPPRGVWGVAKHFVSAGADFTPGVGNVKSAVEAWNGEDPVTGLKLAGWERGLAIAGIVPGLNMLKGVKWAGKGAKYLGMAEKALMTTVTMKEGKLALGTAKTWKKGEKVAENVVDVTEATVHGTGGSAGKALTSGGHKALPPPGGSVAKEAEIVSSIPPGAIDVTPRGTAAR